MLLSVTAKLGLPLRNNLAQNYTVDREVCLSRQEMNVSQLCLVEKPWGRAVIPISIQCIVTDNLFSPKKFLAMFPVLQTLPQVHIFTGQLGLCRSYSHLLQVA